MKSSVFRCRYGGLGIAMAVFAFDQWTKAFIMDVSHDGSFPLEITPFFNLVLVWNRGISFGLLGHAPADALKAWLPYAITLVTLCIALGLTVWLMRAVERPVTVALGFIIGGALGNIVDRLRYGAVADFLDFHWEDLHWPAFNAGDSAIFMGVVILLLVSIIKR